MVEVTIKIMVEVTISRKVGASWGKFGATRCPKPFSKTPSQSDLLNAGASLQISCPKTKPLVRAGLEATFEESWGKKGKKIIHLVERV